MKVINTNLKSVFLLCQAAGQHMVPLKRGRIINFASLLSFQGGITVPAYASSKGGVIQLTKALSNEWSKEGVCVNAIAPGYVETDMNEKLLQDPVRLPQISERIPAGRWGRPEDFAGPVVFLASKASQYVCGEVLVVDGVSFLFLLSILRDTAFHPPLAYLISGLLLPFFGIRTSSAGRPQLFKTRHSETRSSMHLCRQFD